MDEGSYIFRTIRARLLSGFIGLLICNIVTITPADMDRTLSINVYTVDIPDDATSVEQGKDRQWDESHSRATLYSL
jgi:hypothetical protein